MLGFNKQSWTYEVKYLKPDKLLEPIEMIDFDVWFISYRKISARTS